MKIDFSARWWAYLIAIGMIVVVSVLGKLLELLPSWDPANVGMLYILCVAVSTYYFGFGPTITISIISIISFNFFFIEPMLTFTIASDRDVVSWLVLMIVTMVLSFLPRRLWH